MMYRVKDILRLEVAPALGCTEPIAIGLGAAAASLLPGRDAMDRIETWLDPNIFKNGQAVKMTDGIVGASARKTIENIGILSSQGMVASDRTILRIMMDKLKR